MSRFSILLPQTCGYHASISRRLAPPKLVPGFKAERRIPHQTSEGVRDGTDSVRFVGPEHPGIELELQLIDPTSYDLTAASDELLAQMANHPIADRVKPEITRSMIELNSLGA